MDNIDLQIKLVDYVNAATNLAEQMQADLQKGDEYTNETVLKLSEFKAQAERLNNFICFLEKNSAKYN